MGIVIDCSRDFKRIQDIGTEIGLLTSLGFEINAEYLAKMCDIQNKIAILREESESIRERMRASGYYKSLGNSGGTGGCTGPEGEDVCYLPEGQ